MPFRDMQALANALLEPFSETQEFLQKLSDPPFLSVFSAALGLDWRSSGHTQHALELMKCAMKDRLSIVGGKTRKAFAKELRGKTNLLGALRMAQKVDTCAMQEGVGELALQYIAFDEHEQWVVISQKLTRQDARRYHWSPERKSFVESPYYGIIGEKEQTVLDLTAHSSAQARKAITDLAQEPVNRLNKQVSNLKAGQRSFFSSYFPAMPLPKRFFPEYMIAAQEKKPKNFEELLSLVGIGPATIRGLAALSTQFYGAVPSFSDPRTHDWGGKVHHIGSSSLDKYAKLFLNIAEQARIGKRQKFEIAERLCQLAEKSL